MSKMCPRCGKEIKDTWSMCPVCAKIQNREYYLSRGICPYCHEVPIFGEEKSCPECKAEFANRSAAFRDANREHSNRLGANSHKRTYWKRREAGICVYCGKRKAVPGMSRCGICRAKKVDANRKVSIKNGNEIPRSERVSNGLCYFCGEPLDREGRSCTKCADRCSATLVYARTKIVENPWKNEWKLRVKKDEVSV